MLTANTLVDETLADVGLYRPELVREFQWPETTRAKQRPPDSADWFCYLLRSGRGFGKTFTGANWVIQRAYEMPDYPIALIGQTKGDVRDTMVEVGESSILGQSPDWFRPEYQPSKRRVVWPNGAIAMLYSGDEPDQLRGPEHGSAWVDELAKFKYPKKTWDMMELGLRLGPKPQVVVTTTPRPIPIIRRLLDDSGVIDVIGSTYENVDNLADRYLDRVKRQYEGTRLGEQELYGKVLDDVPGALWTRDLLEQYRVHEIVECTRLVVAIDPAVTATEESSETGIVAAGIGTSDLHGYVLDDFTLRGSPDQWARRAVDAYWELEADCIVAEVNNGGDLVESNIKTVDSRVKVKQVRAARGKYNRAEPVAALYEQGKVHHVGLHAALEDQMCTWVQGEKSPDRLDALVWALKDLMLGRSNRAGNA